MNYKQFDKFVCSSHEWIKKENELDKYLKCLNQFIIKHPF